MKTVTYRLSKTFNAPRGFVFDWCTDFREDDAKYVGASWRRHILEKNSRTVVWILHSTQNGRETEGVRIVTLNPKNSWHLLDYDDDLTEIGDYRLTSEGRLKTRLDMVFRDTYKSGKPEARSGWEERVGKMWDRYKSALESEYAESVRR
ncbi:MAG: hypothetical protein KIY12_05290 [Thermoplasmata archaeon]|uniref:Uncharacterized protein n=1 Tax=Candidatus Sysuiplasma superficiale TaxID=2823368 RepID=A0A8J7YQ46_9ARCH|nr:hypothetical protein [Candidatus Sysuiplasma superficiale]MBX8644123.1 hypothetical protein [Candidatus Sysuiplasma superficiale]MCL4346476.1 hypothetical protein [Candidatus Thermoplasmatota archaeon]